MTSDPNFLSNLINGVRDHKCLYDKKNPQYYNKLKKDNAWEVIARQCNKSVALCRNKWKSLRERFSREIRKIDTLSEGELVENQKWDYFQDLMFLKDSMTQRRFLTNKKQYSVPVETEITEYDSKQVQDVDSDEHEHFGESSTLSTSLHLKTERNSLDDFASFEETDCKPSLDFITQSKTDELFLMSISALMQDLPLHLKDKFQADVYQHIYKFRSEMREDIPSSN